MFVRENRRTMSAIGSPIKNMWMTTAVTVREMKGVTVERREAMTIQYMKP